MLGIQQFLLATAGIPHLYSGTGAGRGDVESIGGPGDRIDGAGMVSIDEESLHACRRIQIACWLTGTEQADGQRASLAERPPQDLTRFRFRYQG